MQKLIGGAEALGGGASEFFAPGNPAGVALIGSGIGGLTSSGNPSTSQIGGALAANPATKGIDPSMVAQVLPALDGSSSSGGLASLAPLIGSVVSSGSDLKNQLMPPHQQGAPGSVPSPVRPAASLMPPTPVVPANSISPSNALLAYRKFIAGTV